MYGGMALRTVFNQSEGAIEELKRDTKNRSKGSLMSSVNEVKNQIGLRGNRLKKNYINFIS